MACGLPVVATATGGIPEQVDDQKTGFLAPIGDATTVANYILKILDSKDLLMQFAYESQQRAKQMFDAERMVNEYVELYSEMQSEFARVRSDTDPSRLLAESQQEQR
jgi:glycosyltransferase involved in cell wall biosynthesis